MHSNLRQKNFQYGKVIIIIIIRLYGLSKQLAFIAIHEFIQSGLEALQ